MADTTITITVTARATYEVQLSAKAAKAIGITYADPDEKWADEAEMALQSAFQDAEDAITELVAKGLPAALAIQCEGQPVKLTLQTSDLEVEEVEVQA